MLRYSVFLSRSKIVHGSYSDFLPTGIPLKYTAEDVKPIHCYNALVNIFRRFPLFHLKKNSEGVNLANIFMNINLLVCSFDNMK